MKKPKETIERMRDEYDLSRGVRGKHTRRFAGGSNVVSSIPMSRRLSRTLLP